MKIEENGNIITVSDKPFLRWAIGFLICLFALLLMYIGISSLFRDANVAVNLGIFATGLIVGFIGFRLVWKYPQITCEIDKYTETLTYKTAWMWRKRSEMFQLREIKTIELAKKDALSGEDKDKCRAEFVFRDGKRLPVGSRWRLNDKFCQTVADKLNSTIPKLNQRKKEKLESWKQ